MPVTSSLKTPGVYVTEEDAFPPSIVGVQTAVPAFIGYTEFAEIGGKPCYQKPQKISSFAEYVSIYGKGFEPVINITEVPAVDVQADPDKADVSLVEANGTVKYYKLTQTSDTRFYLYASMKLFYDNGGQQCYVVSVGDYTNQGATPAGVHVALAPLDAGLSAIGEVTGPTMLVIPDAVLLPSTTGQDPWDSADFYTLVSNMLKQCAALQDRVAILDVYGTQVLNQSAATFKNDMTAVIDTFRAGVGTENLSYGMAYFPFLNTSTFPSSDINYLNFTNSELLPVLKLQSAAMYSGDQLTAVDAMIDLTTTTTEPANAVLDLDSNLRAALPILGQMESQVALTLGVLPPSGGMAGVYTAIDATRGVWNAPANVSLVSVIDPTVRINNDMQADLNVPLDGKAIDAIRQFPSRGNVVWGARTLLGNSNDWRYIQVRRTIIYIEQSIKNAMMPFVFAPNTGQTWSTVVSSVSNFLQGLWSQGGLMGSTAAEAYTVECGLGSTMTAQDILDGYMIVQVQLQMIRPAEFIVLTFKQKMLEA
jgi:phage tail sheath protein FI